MKVPCNHNVLSVTRYGLMSSGATGVVDDITMSYDGNRLTGGEDTADEVVLEGSPDQPQGEFSCEYDEEGRLIADSSRGIKAITYSYSGMPLEIVMDNGGRFTYTYTADDVRLMEVYYGVTSVGGKFVAHDIPRIRYFMGPMEFKADRRLIGTLYPNPKPILPDPLPIGSAAENEVISGGECSETDMSDVDAVSSGISRSEPSGFDRVSIPWGYFDGNGRMYTFIHDHQGNVRAVVDNAGHVVQTTDYYPYGLPMATSTNPDVNRRKHTGKELETRAGLNVYDFAARQYNPMTLRMDRIDPMAGKYTPYSPYLFCGANPLMYTDPSGEEWYRVLDESNGTYNIFYTSCTSQEELDKSNIKGEYLGSIVVIFNGSLNERLGKGNNINGDGAILADVLVYGKENCNDISCYTGFTMSSNFEIFGAIADGEYSVNYVEPGKRGSLKSNYAINNCEAVDCIDGKNPSPKDFNPFSHAQKNGVYIHRTNLSGYAGYNLDKKSAVSTGCLLIAPQHWNDFCKQIGKNDFKLILNRTK